MMGNRSEKKVFMLAACCAASLLGVYMTFFYKSTEEVVADKKTEASVKVADKEVDYQGKELPDIVNETADELYVENEMNVNEIYFTNTKCLDEGNIPLEAQAILVSDVQEFLDRNGYKDVTELYLIEESYMETAERISFLCLMNVDEHKEALQIEYIVSERCLKYYILPDSTDIGAGNEEQHSGS